MLKSTDSLLKDQELLPMEMSFNKNSMSWGLSIICVFSVRDLRIKNNIRETIVKSAYLNVCWCYIRVYLLHIHHFIL